MKIKLSWFVSTENECHELPIYLRVNFLQHFYPLCLIGIISQANDQPNWMYLYFIFPMEQSLSAVSPSHLLSTSLLLSSHGLHSSLTLFHLSYFCLAMYPSLPVLRHPLFCYSSFVSLLVWELYFKEQIQSVLKSCLSKGPLFKLYTMMAPSVSENNTILEHEIRQTSERLHETRWDIRNQT